MRATLKYMQLVDCKSGHSPLLTAIHITALTRPRQGEAAEKQAEAEARQSENHVNVLN